MIHPTNQREELLDDSPRYGLGADLASALEHGADCGSTRGLNCDNAAVQAPCQVGYGIIRARCVVPPVRQASEGLAAGHDVDAQGG
jgi:hypothetical protein